MSRRSPQLTSTLAFDIYALTKAPSKDEAIRLLNRQYGGSLVFADSNLLTAKTGGLGVKVSTGFGFVLLGKKEPYKGHAFIVFRGTQLLADWLTNLNVTTSRSDSGHLVHAGFHSSFNTMKPRINDFIKVVNQPRYNINTVHCIGHSLGGALATLCANWISTKKSTYLYTFGSPRVGFGDFAQHITKKLNSEHIFRVYNKTDPVPKLLPWPYVHVPSSGDDYYMYYPGGLSIESHLKKAYIDNIGGRNWDKIKAEKEEVKTDFGIARWLESKGAPNFSVTTLKWLEQALMFVLKKCVGVAHTALLGLFGGGITIIDKLAYILAKGIDISNQISYWVLLFIKKIMQVLGLRPVSDAMQLTRDYGVNN